jgi:hypothetical protein
VRAVAVELRPEVEGLPPGALGSTVVQWRQVVVFPHEALGSAVVDRLRS